MELEAKMSDQKAKAQDQKGQKKQENMVSNLKQQLEQHQKMIFDLQTKLKDKTLINLTDEQKVKDFDNMSLENSKMKNKIDVLSKQEHNLHYNERKSKIKIDDLKTENRKLNSKLEE